MDDNSKLRSPRLGNLIANVGTALMAGASLLLTMHTMRVYRVWDDGIFTLLMLSPCLLALAILAGFTISKASRRSLLALVTATAVLTAMTFGTYMPELASGPGGCMSGLIVLASVPILIGFLLVFGLAWFVYGIGLRSSSR